MSKSKEKLEKLGLRAIACPRWRWMPGMRSLVGPGRAPYRYVTNEYAPPEGEDVGFSDPIVPDLSDPATLGCLLHLVREATGQQSSASWYPGGKHDYPHWAWYSDDCYGKLCEGATEAECLVRVLEYIQ